MIKRFCAAFFAVIFTTICICGCGAQATVDTDALTKAVLSEVKFESELTEVNETVLSVTYALPEGAVGTAYLGSSTAADQLAVFTLKNADDAKTVKTMLEQKVTSLHDTFAAYDVPELTKIDNAVIRVKGNYAVFCITDDYENAAKLIDKYI